MTLAPETSAEAERQRVLNVLGFPADEQLPALTALTRLAARQCDCVASAISLVAADRQVFIAALGIDIADIPRAGGLFELTMGSPNGLVVPDARSDPRFTGNPLLALDPPLVFYAGVSLNVGGHAIGTISVMDRHPRRLADDQLAALHELATACSALLEARHRERLAASVVPAQSRLKAVLQALPDLWFVLDAADRYVECSDEKHPSLARPFAELHGRDFGPGLPSALAVRGLAAIRAARSSGAVQCFEYDLEANDGQHRSFEVRVSPMAGGLSLFLTRDLASQRQREREVMVLQRALEAEAAQPICIADAAQPDFPLVYVNPAFERLTGRSRNAVLGQNCRFLQGARANEPALAVLRAALAQGQPCTVTLRNERSDGSSFINELHVAPVHDSDGRLTHFVGMPSDVTERVVAAEQLALSEELARAVAAAIDDSLIVIDPDDVIRGANPAACEMFGATAERLIGARLGELGITLLTEDGRAVADAEHPLNRASLGAPGRRDAVYLLRRGDAPPRRVRLSVRPLQADSTARQPTCLLTLSDIAAAQAAELAARERQATDLANRAKSEFLSRVSHEMRTPLNAVIGFTQLLRLAPGGAGPAQVADYTDHVLRASEHLLGLINDLLDLQRVDEQRLTLQLQPLAVTTLVGATFALLKPLAMQHGVALRNEVEPDAWVRADAQRFRQVLINVVSNAIKYNRSGGWVRIGASRVDEGRLVLEVSDTGSGMTQDQLGRLFQPFERLGQESSGIEGSGLGLVIARRLAVAMGGSLTLSSVPASGTRVQIGLPSAAAPLTAPATAAGAHDLVGSSASQPRTPADAAAPASRTVPAARFIAEPSALDGQGLRMLYVEDNRINAILFEEAVRMRGGIELQVAEDGAEALALVQQWRPEVLVLDANLPDMSGYDVLAQMRKMPALEGVPAFMCSADAMEADLQRATAAGFIGYWTKPIDIARVMRDLDRLRLQPPAH